MKKLILILLALVFGMSGHAQGGSPWSRISSEGIENASIQFEQALSEPAPLYEVNTSKLQADLSRAILKTNGKDSRSGVLISIPDGNGNMQRFSMFKSAVIHPELAARYPDILHYTGAGIDDPSASIKLSLTVFGLHGMILSAKHGTSYIEPYTKDKKTYIVYKRKSLTGSPAFDCEFAGEDTEVPDTHNRSGNTTESNTGIFRVYRLALSSTIEYSNFHVNQAGQSGGTLAQKKAAVLAAMTVTMNRVNGVYERDFSLSMQLVPNNDILINITSDNFSNGSGGAMLGENQSFVDSNIGGGNYDIGHVFSTGGGGVAALGSVCVNGVKARGVTGSGAPVGNPFDIDYVAHEMGHQFGATHTFNSGQGSCAGNITNSTAVEPGSGTTIMAYAGICGSHNVQGNSDDHFHAVSMAQIDNHISGAGNCAVNTPSANNAPVITPLTDYTIPKGTAFVLRGNAFDPDGNTLTYCWEQIDTGAQSQPPSATSTTGANFRSRTPSTSPDRYMPALGSAASTWEVLSTVQRFYTFALTVRDNDLFNGGQTQRDDMVVNVANVGPFVVTSPNSALTWQGGSSQTVTWNVSGTDMFPINSAFVDIYMSTNGGNTYPVMLASKVPNDGSEMITVPNTPGSANRIMVVSNDNIFFDVSNANFTISSAPAGFSVAFNGTSGQQNKGGCLGSDVQYTFNYNTFGGFSSPATFSVTGTPPGTTVTFNPTTATAPGPVTMTISNTAASGEGFYPMVVTATSGSTSKSVNFYLNLVDAIFTPISLSSPANNSTGMSPEVTLSWQPDPFSATSYDIQVATDPAFGNVIASGNTTGSSFQVDGLAPLTEYYWRVLPKNEACDGNYSEAFKFTTAFCSQTASTNVPVTISASGTPTVTSTITIPNSESQMIQDLNVNLNISHSWIRDLTVRLISPQGTEAILFSTLCANEAGHQNAVVTFDDSGSPLNCSAVNPAVQGVKIPVQPLSVFNGQMSEGTWTLQISDSSNQDGGALNSWSLDICSLEVPLKVEDPVAYSFAAYPNPNNGSFSISSDRELSENARIRIYDLRGRVIYDRPQNNPGRLDTTIRLDNTESGVYLLSVTDGDIREVKRIIIQ